MGEKKKVKTGCLTCKKRRVKCDETWPICHRCSSTGRFCDGYGIWGGGGHAQGSAPRRTAIKPPPTPKRAGRGLGSPIASLTPGLSQFPNLKGASEILAFEFFWEKTTIKLIGVFESAFWKSLILQACSHEPAVLHAVVATGAAHRRQETLALQQYNKAITFLSASQNRQDKLARRLTLTACLVFICLELLRGEFRAGYLHMQKGLLLLGEHLSDGSGGGLGNGCPSRVLSMPKDPTDAHLLEAFFPLSLQGDMFGLDHCFSMRLSSSLTLDMPHEFTSLRDSRLQLLKIINAVHGLSAQAAREHTPGLPTSTKLELLKQDIQFALIKWHRAIEHSDQSIFASPTAEMAREVLKGHHLLTTLQADTALRSDEMVFDNHHDTFAAILQTAQDVWDMARAYLRTYASPNDRTSFTLDLGFIPPLYFTAVKCRDPVLRRKALQMLVDTSHREGIWDGYLVARIARHVVRLEEGDFYDVPINGPVEGMAQAGLPAERRFNSVRVEPLTQCSGSRVRLVLRRFDPTGPSDTIYEEVDIANDGPPTDYPIPKRRLT